MMTPYTKRSLIHLILSVAVLILGVAVFVLLSGSIHGWVDQPVDENAGLAEIGKFFAIFAGFAMIIFVGIINTVLTSALVYTFAYFSHQNAKLAIDEGGDTTRAPRVLRVISLIEMILTAIISIGGGLLILFVLAFN